MQILGQDPSWAPFGGSTVPVPPGCERSAPISLPGMMKSPGEEMKQGMSPQRSGAPLPFCSPQGQGTSGRAFEPLGHTSLLKR